ncbi:MAG TPA: type II toxin-antitoxin system VapC family toxin [Polyangiaceae bacterium]|jgi:predicted nucleic acid-binding protein
MTVVVDASVVVRWFVAQPGHAKAAGWLERFVSEPELLVAPDLLRFEVFGALCRLQSPSDPGWVMRCFDRFERLGMRTLPTTLALFQRASEMSRELRIGGYDAVYLALAEGLGIPWLTADEKALRRLRKDRRVLALG